jgi:hypothetical protein
MGRTYRTHGEKMNDCRVSEGKPEEKRRIWEDNINSLKPIGHYMYCPL